MIKRYNGGLFGMVERADITGKYVLHSDYKALEAKYNQVIDAAGVNLAAEARFRENLCDELDEVMLDDSELVATVRAVVAENKQLTTYIRSCENALNRCEWSAIKGWSIFWLSVVVNIWQYFN